MGRTVVGYCHGMVWLFKFLRGMLILRLSQGALLTATMAYLISGREGHELSRVIAFYISATIFGGTAGRVVFGQLASYIEQERVASIWAALLLLVRMAQWRRATPKPLNFGNPDAQIIKEALISQGDGLIFLSVFCMFWVFAGYLNYLPFRTNEVDSDASTGLIGQSYLGYSIGIVSALTTSWLAKGFGWPIRVAIIGFIVMIGFLILSLGNVWMLIAQVFVIYLSMLVIHTLAALVVNHNARSLGGVVNGL